jgi:hypothetical protein
MKTDPCSCDAENTGAPRGFHRSDCAAIKQSPSQVTGIVETVSGLALDKSDLHLVREWFDSVQDVNPGYLEEKDYVLAKRIYEALGMRVPNSIASKTKA